MCYRTALSLCMSLTSKKSTITYSFKKTRFSNIWGKIKLSLFAVRLHFTTEDHISCQLRTGYNVINKTTIQTLVVSEKLKLQFKGGAVYHHPEYIYVVESCANAQLWINGNMGTIQVKGNHCLALSLQKSCHMWKLGLNLSHMCRVLQ